jgi:hypothetical protein
VKQGPKAAEVVGTVGMGGVVGRRTSVSSRVGGVVVEYDVVVAAEGGGWWLKGWLGRGC